MLTSESIKEIALAMNQFQQEVEQPSKSADNPFFKSKYVPLENVISTIKKYAIPKGLSYFQDTMTNEKGDIGIRTRIQHVSGQFIETDILYLPNDKKNAQGAGSSITYARRYQLSAAFGIASDEDDDGNGAAGVGKDTSTPKGNATNEDDKKQANNDFFKQKKEILNRIKALAVKTLADESAIKDFIISTSNERLNKKYTDFNSKNLETGIDVLLTLEDKANKNNKVAK